MYLYPSKTHGRLNRGHFAPESVDLRAMCNPHYANLLDFERPDAPPLLPGTRAVEDSGAFQERDMLARLTPDEALDRQLRHEQRLRDDGCGPDFHFEAVVTYDMLVGVDEAIVDGKRVKRRGNEETAEAAVCETLASALAYRRRRDEVQGVIAYAAQGGTLRQYVGCVEALLCLMRPGKDWLALGGFCIIGMQPSLKPLFAEVCRAVAPLLRRHRTPRAHVLGVCADDALRVAAGIFDAEGVEFSTDSSSIERNAAVFGKEWREENMLRWEGASPWAPKYTASQKGKPGGYDPATFAVENIARFDRWCKTLGAGGADDGRTTAAPRTPVRPLQPYQATLF